MVISVLLSFLLSLFSRTFARLLLAHTAGRGSSLKIHGHFSIPLALVVVMVLGLFEKEPSHRELFLDGSNAVHHFGERRSDWTATAAFLLLVLALHTGSIRGHLVVATDLSLHFFVLLMFLMLIFSLSRNCEIKNLVLVIKGAIPAKQH